MACSKSYSYYGQLEIRPVQLPSLPPSHLFGWMRVPSKVSLSLSSLSQVTVPQSVVKCSVYPGGPGTLVLGANDYMCSWVTL